MLLRQAIFVLIAMALSSLNAFSDSELKFDFRKNMRHIGAQPEGFALSTALELPFSFSHSQSRLGVESGSYLDLAGKIKTALHYRRELHDWSTSAFLSESYSMSPSIKNRWIKSLDLLRFETRYLYNVLPRVSPYVHARLETSIFESVDLQESESTYELRNIDGTKRETVTLSELKLSDPFRPLYFQESIGVAIALVEKTYFTWEIKTALSFRQTIADNQRVFVKETDDARIIRDLHSFYQIGPLLGTAINGHMWDDKIEYSVGIDIVWPFWQQPIITKRDFLNSLIVEASAGITLKLTDWSSLDYQYTASRVPDILEKFQQNHILNLDISFEWVYLFGQEPQLPLLTNS